MNFSLLKDNSYENSSLTIFPKNLPYEAKILPHTFRVPVYDVWLFMSGKQPTANR